MGIKKYKFEDFASKDMFMVRLAGEIPDFGLIPCTKQFPFFSFCVEHGFISLRTQISDQKPSIYNVHTTFRFSTMFDYRARPIICNASTGSVMVTTDFRMTNQA